MTIAQRSAAVLRPLTLAGALAASFGAAWAAPVKVGVVLSLSGPGTATADGANKGIQLAADAINARSTTGPLVELIVVDDATDPKTANDVCSRLVLKDQVQAILGVETTPARLSCNQHALKAGIPYVAASSNPGDICVANLFHTGHVSRQMTLPLVDVALGENQKRIYFIGTDYSAPKSMLEVVRERATPARGQVIGSAFAALGTSDFSGELSKIAAMKPDIVFTSFPNADGFTFHRQFSSDPRLQGIRRADVFMTSGMAKALGTGGQGVYVSTGYILDDNSPANTAFREAYARKFGAQSQPDIWAVNAYNGMQLLGSALATAQSGPALIAALKKAKYMGPSGEVEMMGLYAKAPTYVAMTAADGAMRVLPKYTTALPPADNCPAR